MTIAEVVDIIDKYSKPEVIEGLNCFVLDFGNFQKIWKWADDVTKGTLYVSDTLARKHQLENFELRLSTTEEGKYYLCAKSEPFLDRIWKQRYKA